MIYLWFRTRSKVQIRHKNGFGTSSNAFEDGVKKADGQQILIRREIERLYLSLNSDLLLRAI
jgi:hypothetical protein